MDGKYTRRKFLKLAGLSTAGIPLIAAIGCEAQGSSPETTTSEAAATVRRAPATSPNTPSTTVQAGPGDVQAFRSRPDLSPPVIEVTTLARGTASGSGYFFVAAKNGVGGEEHPSQDGAMILDERGRPVWLRPVSANDHDIMVFRAQRYRGEPVLTWWEGAHAGWGQGEYVVSDASYREVARFGAGNGYAGDHHEFLISARDTAFILIYHETPMDLSSVGGPVNGIVVDGIVQEIDIASNEVVFEWHSLDHVGLDESYYAPDPDPAKPFDYFHINSVDVDDDDNLLISSRKTSAVFKIDRVSGGVIWRLGGKYSDFEMGEGAPFVYQHDARRQTDGTITVFDNRDEARAEPSRGIVLELDEAAMTANLAREYVHPDGVFGIFQGNMQVLNNGNVFIGWGSAPYISEFSPDGRLLFDARFPLEVESYRAYHSPWTGRPDDSPAIAVETGDTGEVTVYASWNGATEVDNWQVLAGPGADRLKPAGSVSWEDFETAILVSTAEPYVAIQGRSSSNKVLGASEAIGL